ncbi:MAG: hypoxanthine-guanine phosphoribosyltransferase [Pseudomonadota bacterium]
MMQPPSTLVFSSREIGAAIDYMATAIDDRCGQDEWIAMCVLNGGLIFTSELLQRLSARVRLDSVRVSRYHNTTTGKELRWHAKPESRLEGQRILLLDDIFDEGETLAALSAYLLRYGAREVFTAVLLEKDHNRKVDTFRPDLVGLRCPDIYVYGFGMDYEGLYRNLPEIRALEP